jgi:hypothetical protein
MPLMLMLMLVLPCRDGSHAYTAQIVGQSNRGGLDSIRSTRRACVPNEGPISVERD